MSGTVLSNQDTAVNKMNTLVELSSYFSRDDTQVNKSLTSFKNPISPVKKQTIQERNRDGLLM